MIPSYMIELRKHLNVFHYLRCQLKINENINDKIINVNTLKVQLC